MGTKKRLKSTVVPDVLIQKRSDQPGYPLEVSWSSYLDWANTLITQERKYQKIFIC